MSALFLSLLLTVAPPESHVASPGNPAVLHPLVETAARCSANPQLVIALTAFTPPRRGTASLLVSLRTTGGRLTRLGEVGVFPHRPFSASLADARRFGFAIPAQGLDRDSSVVVEVASEANPAGARAVVGEARITPAPQERCS
jgi:hypothetical protein